MSDAADLPDDIAALKAMLIASKAREVRKDERIERLETFPLRGAMLPELEPLGMREFRQIIAAPYRIVYRLFDRRVVIVLIAHGRRDFTQLLEERLLR